MTMRLIFVTLIEEMVGVSEIVDEKRSHYIVTTMKATVRPRLLPSRETEMTI